MRARGLAQDWASSPGAGAAPGNEGSEGYEAAPIILMWAWEDDRYLDVGGGENQLFGGVVVTYGF